MDVLSHLLCHFCLECFTFNFTNMSLKLFEFFSVLIRSDTETSSKDKIQFICLLSPLLLSVDNILFNPFYCNVVCIPRTLSACACFSVFG